MSNFSFKNVDPAIIKQIKTTYLGVKKEQTNSAGVIIIKPDEKTTISIYQNKTILVQGGSIPKYLQDLGLTSTSQPKPQTIAFNDFNVLGCDEVGVGDFFGPIVTCCAYVKSTFKIKHPEVYALLKDSKKLSDQEIKATYLKIKGLVPYSVYVMGNKTYNQEYQKYQNINTLKTLAHNQALTKFYETNPNLKIDYVLMDQFVRQELYYQHLTTNNLTPAPYDIYFETKAEDKAVAVACASIIARNYFLTALQKITDTYQVKVLLGASNEVKKLVNGLKQTRAGEITNFLKLNFNSKIK